MAFHHVALATTDLDATHRFYTEAMGFTLVRTVVAPTGSPGGWAKHVFYDMRPGWTDEVAAGEILLDRFDLLVQAQRLTRDGAQRLRFFRSGAEH